MTNVQETYSFIIIYKEQCWKFCLKGYTNYFKKTKYILYKFSIANNIVLKVTANFPNQYYFWIFGTMSENFVLLPFFSREKCNHFVNCSYRIIYMYYWQPNIIINYVTFHQRILIFVCVDKEINKMKINLTLMFRQVS